MLYQVSYPGAPMLTVTSNRVWSDPGDFGQRDQEARSVILPRKVSSCRCSQNNIQTVNNCANMAVTTHEVQHCISCLLRLGFSVSTPPQLVTSRWETAEASRTTARTADPCRTSLELTQMRTLHCNQGPWGNLGRTLSASLLLCSIWRAPPPALEGLTPFFCFFLFQVCLLFFSQTQRTPHGNLQMCAWEVWISSSCLFVSTSVSALKPRGPNLTDTWVTLRLFCPNCHEECSTAYLVANKNDLPN